MRPKRTATYRYREYQGRTELRKAAARRLRDAEKLLDAGGLHTHCAAYVAGYAIKCKLKAIAMEVFDVWTLSDLVKKWNVDDRDVFTHGLECFAKRLPLYSRFQQSAVWKDFTGQVNRWRPSWRYMPGNPKDEYRDRSFLEAVKRVYQWLEANRG